MLFRNSPVSFNALQCARTVRPAARARPVRSKAWFMRRDQPNVSPSGVLTLPRNLMCSQNLQERARQTIICSAKLGGGQPVGGFRIPRISSEGHVPNIAKWQVSRQVSRSMVSRPQSLHCLSDSSGHGPSSWAQLITTSASPPNLADIEPCTAVRPKGGLDMVPPGRGPREGWAAHNFVHLGLYYMGSLIHYFV